MSAETITTAIFLITAVVATAVLVNAIYPVISTTAGTFSSSTHEADSRLRTDFKIVAAFNVTDPVKPNIYYYDIYMKNIGSQRISLGEISSGDVFCGKTVGNRLSYSSDWTATILPAPNDGFWDPGETLLIETIPSTVTGSTIYFQFILPNGIWRSTEFS
ncbi:MAG: flagellin [Methanomicrobiales archaeon HGW-Methanomicrobiales-5]|nr:MAG: flagellin [Methanomicrobiales archaeon HGW-Methanomicrobiales-5]